MTQAKFRIRLARRLDRIRSPATYVLPDFSMVASKPEQITFSTLEPPNQYQELTIAPLPSILFQTVIVLPEIIVSDGDFEELGLNLKQPDIEMLFEPLRKPRLAGKAYRDDDDAIDRPSDNVQDVARTNLDLSDKCQHGLPRALCAFCRQASQRATQAKPKTVDVFEQLRFILQPPILERLGQPEVFPSGRKPYDFQIFGIKWLLEHPQALLADEMGLGKTIQSVIAMRILFRRGTLQRVLVVCPVGVVSPWAREIRDWAPEFRVIKIGGPVAVRREQWKAPASIYIVSYETLARDIGDLPSRVFDLCIIDEAQKIKNPNTDRSRGVKRIQAERRWALTGTPLENRTDDTVSIFGYVVPGLFPGQETVSPSLLRQKIGPHVLRRTKEDVLDDLPDLIHRERWLELTDAQRDAYDQMEIEGVENLRRLGATATRVHIFSLISKLKQICNYDDETGDSCKLEFLKEQLEKLVENGEKALVFSQYPNVTLRKIMPFLEEYSPVIYDGTLSERERTRIVDDFQREDTVKVMLMGVGSGGLGITLTRANHVFHFDHWWNPAVIDQATARAHRISQERDVIATSLYASDTIEERIATLLQTKRGLFQDVFGQMVDDEGTKLSDEDLFGLFDLPIPGTADERTSESLSPTEFEEQIRRLFSMLGFNLRVTRQTRDGGIDLVGSASGIGGGRVVVQCKRYSGTVPVREVRDLLGVVSSDTSISQGFLVTTGKFSNDAREFSKGQRVRLIDGTELRMLLRKHLQE